MLLGVAKGVVRLDPADGADLPVVVVIASQGLVRVPLGQLGRGRRDMATEEHSHRQMETATAEATYP